MQCSDALLGVVLLERGWLDRAALDACLREPGGLVPALLRRRVLPAEELDLLRAEISRVLEQPGDDAEAARALRRDGLLSQEQLEEATSVAGLPLRQALLEKGFVPLSALQAALQAPVPAATAVACRRCRARSSIEAFDPDRVYLCKACRGELAPSEEPDVDGEFGRYKSTSLIGRGGMSAVYKGWDDVGQRWVALKVVEDDAHLEARGTLRREVEIARSLHHPNLVGLYGVARRGSRTLIVMEYVDGETLAGRRFPPAKAAALVAAVARGVQHAHARGIVHRDIKPQNILLERSGRPVLVDFGLAKSDVAPSYTTSVGTVKGTPSYLAPEQALGVPSRIDRRTDVYGLGAVLYDLLTGRAPHRGSTPMDTLKKVLTDPIVPPSSPAPEVPPALERIVLRCLEKDKNLRYPTARALADDLETFAAPCP